MSDEKLIEGYTLSDWQAVSRVFDENGDFPTLRKMIEPMISQASGFIFSEESEAQSAQIKTQRAIGFIKFANVLASLSDRARFIVERGVSPDTAIQDAPV